MTTLYRIFLFAFSSVLFLSSVVDVRAEELVLINDKKSDYQIVLPDESEVAASLAQTARLIQTAFKANGAAVPVVKESERQPEHPGIYLGDTARARAAGVEAEKFPGWSYEIRSLDKDVLIVGCDRPALTNSSFERLGTTKGVVDFLREFAGVRFLYPDIPFKTPLSGAEKIDLLSTPSIEYQPTSRIAIPAGLNRRVEPLVDSEKTGANREGSGFYHIAQNRFPVTDSLIRVHSWHEAVPAQKYGKDHPEYFALINGKRVPEKGGKAQYCISNPAFQELLYLDLVEQFRKGWQAVGLGQPDGFKPCQCDDCGKLFGTSDWGEKIWTLHCNLAERAYKEYPEKTVVVMSYIQTENPPRSIDQFPANVRVLLAGSNEHELGEWRTRDVPRGFSVYTYYWTPSQMTRYTPMQTPDHLESKVRALVRLKARDFLPDGGGGLLYGLEGPVYYTMGRMFDAPEENNSADLVNEYLSAAYGRSASAMKQFFDELYISIEPHARYMGTREPGWRVVRRSAGQPFRTLSFLFPPELMEKLEGSLSRAEQQADGEKVKARLMLVRREFDNLKSLAKVTHLYQAFQYEPSLMDSLLDALDERTGVIASFYEQRAGNPRSRPIPGWEAITLFPPGGHRPEHLRPSVSVYGSPFANSLLAWDTKSKREAVRAQSSGLSSTTVPFSPSRPEVNSPIWKQAPVLKLTPRGDQRMTTEARLLRGSDELYIRIEGEGGGKEGRVEVHLSPDGGNHSYRFTAGQDGRKRDDAARGFIEDALDPRYGQYDSDWEGQWSVEGSAGDVGKRWSILLAVPYKTLKSEPPVEGVVWQGNIIRIDPEGEDREAVALWSARSDSSSTEAAEDFGALIFSEKTEESNVAGKLLNMRLQHDARTAYQPPRAWRIAPAADQLKFGPWLFREDLADQGVAQGWQKVEPFDANGWVPIEMPSYWAENPQVGNIQGYGWYRVEFDLPASAAGRALRLWFDGVDEQAWVYVNGELVGAHTEEAAKKTLDELSRQPFEVKVPAKWARPGRNVLAVRLHNARFNGGIWRPVYGAMEK